jgi:hypothetical protein
MISITARTKLVVAVPLYPSFSGKNRPVRATINAKFAIQTKIYFPHMIFSPKKMISLVKRNRSHNLSTEKCDVKNTKTPVSRSWVD